jgi:DNA polymerase-3 subunit gamma/tau
LLVEGQSPAHFARQMVGFIRNALIAKVAGPDSPLLQISSDEQARVARSAALFGEEDLTRFLQIMLRTYGDVSYKQEQRFHLELGLLKLVHAQRLLPLEQLLSESNLSAGGRIGTTTSASRAPAAPSRTPGTISAGNSNEKPSRPSPFELDRARRSPGGKPEMSAASSIASVAGGQQAAAGTAVAPEAETPRFSPQTADLESIRNALLAALENAGHRMAADTLDKGEWSLTTNAVTVKVSSGEQMIALTFGPEQRRLLQQALESSAGPSLRLSIATGGAKNAVTPASPSARAGGTRAKAAQHPVVRRMMEKFGAELRTVLDNDQ